MLRKPLIVGTMFVRRGRAATRVLAVLVGAALALALCSVFALSGFLAHVSARGQAAEFNLDSPSRGGCIQADSRFDPINVDSYENTLLAARCAHPPTPPGLARFPRPGEVYLSPALAELRSSSSSIRTRYPRVDGLIGPAGLTGSNELRSIEGVAAHRPPSPYVVDTYDRFGANNDYLGNYLRFGIGTLVVVGLFFTLLPALYLVATCTKLNARTRERQLRLLAILGLDSTVTRRALMYEAALTVGAGAVVGLLIAWPVFPRLTPTFVAWTAFPGDFAVGAPTLLLVLALIVGMAAAAASLGARSLARSRRRSTKSVRAGLGLRWAPLIFGMVAALVNVWWHSSSAVWLVLAGRVSTFVGLVLVAAPVCARIGSALSGSAAPILSLIGARLRRPSGSLTRALGALVAGLFVVSAGATAVSSLGADPAAIQRAYAADGYSVVQVRSPNAGTRRVLADYNVLAGRDSGSSPNVLGTVSGSCQAVRATVGDRIGCARRKLYGVLYAGASAPASSNATTTTFSGPRADVLSGFIVNITGRSTITAADNDVFIPLPTGQARGLYDQLVGRDPTTNVRVAGDPDVGGASELLAILDVFRWGAAFAVVISLLAALVSLVALLYDRQPGNNYLQILGVTRRQAAATALGEVTVAAAATLGIALLSSWLWTLSLRSTTEHPPSLLTVAAPFVGALVVFVAAAAALVWGSLRSAAVSVVPDRDGLVSAYDVFQPGQPSAKVH